MNDTLEDQLRRHRERILWRDHLRRGHALPPSPDTLQRLIGVRIVEGMTIGDFWRVVKENTNDPAKRRRLVHEYFAVSYELGGER